MTDNIHEDTLYKYTYKRTPSYVITTWQIRHPGHDLYYRVRENRATGVKQYQPYCKCHGWNHDKWHPHKGERIERIYQYEHINQLATQGQLLDSDTQAQAQDRYGSTHFDNIDRLHDHTL